MMRALFVGLFLSALGMWAASSCDSIEAAFDCNDVCNRYKDCYQSDYNVSACRDNCRAAAARDSNQRAKADACSSCIDDKSCASATFNCSSQCAGIVP